MSRRSAAKLFSVAPSTAIKWVDQKRRTGSVRPRTRGGDYRSHHLEPHADEIVSLADNTDLTLADLADYIRQTHGLRVAPSTIWRLLDRHDMTYKKTAHAAEQQRPDVLRGRQTWFEAQIDLEPERLVFIDGEALRATGPSAGAERGRRPKWPGVMDELCVANAAGHPCLMVTGKRRPSSARSGWRG